MKRNLNIGILFLVVTCGLFACKKPSSNQHLVAKTHEGRNTIGYRTSDGDLIGGELDDQDSVIINESGMVSIYHNLDYYGGTNLQLHLAKDSVLGNYFLQDAGYEYHDRIGYLNDSLPGYLLVDYQTGDILAGTFELNFVYTDSVFEADTLVGVNTAALLEIKNGRFDIRY